MPKVALVFPYFRTRSATELLFPPLGAATLAAQLSRLGIDGRIFDCTFHTFEQFRTDLAAYRPDIVGVYSMVSLTANTLRVAEMVATSLPQALLVAGGPLPTVFPGRYAQLFDAVFRGEADVSFPSFCRDCFAVGASPQRIGDLPLESYGGLFIADHGLHVDNATVHHGESELATFPLPDRSGFDHAAAVCTQRCASKRLRAATRQPIVNSAAAGSETIREMSAPSVPFPPRRPGPCRNPLTRPPIHVAEAIGETIPDNGVRCADEGNAGVGL